MIGSGVSVGIMLNNGRLMTAFGFAALAATCGLAHLALSQQVTAIAEAEKVRATQARELQELTEYLALQHYRQKRDRR